MNSRGFSDKDILKWITIVAGIILGYIIIKALISVA